MGLFAGTQSARVMVRCAMLVASVLFLVLQWGCQDGGILKTSSKTQSMTGSGVPFVNFKPLDDKNNPYRDQYQDWDRWLVGNCNGVQRGIASYASDAVTMKGQMLFTTILDDNGYLVPVIEFQRKSERARKDRTEESFISNSVYITGVGPVVQDMLDRFIAQADEVRASFYPRIPDWLGSNPPLAAVLLPNGEVVTQGQLGSGMSKITAPSTSSPDPQSTKAAKAGGCCGGNDPNKGWFRYSAAGEPLGFTNKPVWWFLYYDAEVNGLPPGAMSGRSDGYAIFKDPETGALLSVYDYDGTKLDAVEPPLRDLHPFAKLRTYRLLQFYNAQNRAAKRTQQTAS